MKNFQHNRIVVSVSGRFPLILLLIFLSLSAGCSGSKILSYRLVGNDWKQATAAAPFPARLSQSVLVFQNRIWVIGGSDNNSSAMYADVWSSEDGVNWTQVTANAAFGPRADHTSVVFGGRMWVIGGRSPGSTPLNDVWSSTDGANWVQETAAAAFSGRYAHSSAASEGRIWVIGGNSNGADLNDVWYTTDGKSWILAAQEAPFSKRQGHSSVYFNNEVWVIGGNNVPEFTEMTSDVWSSSDGVIWTKVSENAFPSRANFPLVSGDGRMWILGGFVTPHNRMDDVWQSIDGIRWTNVSQINSFGVRNLHGGAYFLNRLWVIAGQISATKVVNNVWYSY